MTKKNNKDKNMENDENESGEMEPQEPVLEKYRKQQVIGEIKAFVKQLKNEVEEDAHGPLLRTIPVKPEWKVLWDAFMAMEKEHDLIHRKMETEKDFFWATVHKETGDYSGMTMDTKNNEIKIWGEKEDE